MRDDQNQNWKDKSDSFKSGIDFWHLAGGYELRSLAATATQLDD
jgi:hypothetical protein